MPGGVAAAPVAVRIWMVTANIAVARMAPRTRLIVTGFSRGWPGLGGGRYRRGMYPETSLRQCSDDHWWSRHGARKQETKSVRAILAERRGASGLSTSQGANAHLTVLAYRGHR